MNKRTKAKWLKALRSGKYKQTRGKLQRGGRNCCLGVLAACMGVNPKEAGGSVKDHRRDLLSKKYEKMFGITLRQQNRFSILNDDYRRRYDFLKIADKIENAKLEG